MGDPRPVSGKPLTKAQKRELLFLKGADQVTFGSHRARVQNNLVGLGLARFVTVDEVVDVCRITDLGIEAWRTGRVPPRPVGDPVPPSEGDIRQRLRSLRAEREALQSRLTQVDEQVIEVAAQLEALETAGRA